MGRARQNAAVDLLALISFIPMLISGLVLFIYFPTGSGFQGGKNPAAVLEVLGMVHTDWVMVHNISSFIFSGLVVIHLILHLNYMRNIRKCLRTQTDNKCPADQN